MPKDKPSTREAKLKAEAVLWHALAKHSDKLGDRDRLLAGEAHRVEASISARINDAPLSLMVAGVLTVNHDQLRSKSTAPPTAELLALVLAKLPKATREKFLDELPKQFAAQALPQADETLIKLCESLLSKLRYSTEQVCRGSVSFKPDPDPVGQAAAKAA